MGHRKSQAGALGVYAVREDDTAYYLRRAAEELARAEHSPCAQVAEAHREMHRLYQAIVEQDTGKRRTGNPVSATAPSL